MSNKYAFTLVELIVVVTILAILATIGFVSYSGYLTGVRDTNRIASLTSISDGLELYRTRNDLPDPDDAIDIQVEGVDIAHQGYVGSNVLQTIEYSKAGKDPKDDSYYSYYLTDDKKYYQLMAFLEESDNLDTHNITSTSHAASDYKNRYPKVYGKKLGILTDTNNSPVQEVTTGTLNFTGGTTSAYRARLTDSEIIEGSGSILKSISAVASCKRIKQLKGGARDGVYSINPSGTGAFDVYCDMTTDGGGWTLYGINANNPNLSPTIFFGGYGTINTIIEDYTDRVTWSIPLSGIASTYFELAVNISTITDRQALSAQGSFGMELTNGILKIPNPNLLLTTDAQLDTLGPLGIKHKCDLSQNYMRELNYVEISGNAKLQFTDIKNASHTEDFWHWNSTNSIFFRPAYNYCNIVTSHNPGANIQTIFWIR